MGADWEALYGDYPVIRELYVVNENDASSGVVRFDALSITNVLAVTVTESAASVSETFATCPTLASWTDPRVGENPQDTAPSAACSAGALGLADNTWKTFSIGSVGLTSATYMRVVMGIATAAELQGFGVQAASDDTTLLLVPEENELNDVRWVHTLSNRHQPTGVSRTYDVAVGRLWQAVHGPSGPTSVQHVVLANDDDTPPYGGAVSFDEVSIYDRVETIPSLLPTPATRARYFVNDHLGTPVALTDADGDVIWSTERDPWGGRHGVTGATGVVQPFDMPGQYWDAETGLSYNWNRYYVRSTGQYVQEDPIPSLGFASYLYGLANPSRFKDPAGLEVVNRSEGVVLVKPEDGDWVSLPPGQTWPGSPDGVVGPNGEQLAVRGKWWLPDNDITVDASGSPSCTWGPCIVLPDKPWPDPAKNPSWMPPAHAPASPDSKPNAPLRGPGCQ